MSKKNPKRILYYKYHHHIRFLKKDGVFYNHNISKQPIPDATTKTAEITFSGNLLKEYFKIYVSNEFLFALTDIQQLKNIELWLKYNLELFSDIKVYWKESSAYRYNTLENKNINEILEQWPLYKHSDASVLVNFKNIWHFNNIFKISLI